MKRIVATFMAVVALIATVVFLVARSNGTPVTGSVRLEAGARDALDSCHRLQGFMAAAKRNASADEVYAILDRSLVDARRALDADPHWVRLVSAITTIDYALRHDDAAAAGTGSAIMREMCAELGVIL